MSNTDILVLSPLIILGLTAVLIMLAVSFVRDHRLAAIMAAVGVLAAAFAAVFVSGMLPRMITPLLQIDRYSTLFLLLVLGAGLAVIVLSYPSLASRPGHREEYYLLVLVALMGCSLLTGTAHVASLFLGMELLSVSLYALTAYDRHNELGVEAGIKYLILAAVSSAFLLFGAALVYAGTGTLVLHEIVLRTSVLREHTLVVTGGIVLVLCGIGFKLGIVPFHLWTPDVYEGAPTPVTAFVATASKGAVVAALLRISVAIDLPSNPRLFMVLWIISLASMLVGSLLALVQTNIKRILACSSIAHLGYVLVPLMAGGRPALSSAAFYLTAYVITTLGAFGVVAALSSAGSPADRLEDYRGLAWQRPWLAAFFSAVIFSLAGLPLTVGFMAKFYLAMTGASAGLWVPLGVLVATSIISLFFYLRIILVLFARPVPTSEMPPR